MKRKIKWRTIGLLLVLLGLINVLYFTKLGESLTDNPSVSTPAVTDREVLEYLKKGDYQTLFELDPGSLQNSIYASIVAHLETQMDNVSEMEAFINALFEKKGLDSGNHVEEFLNGLSEQAMLQIRQMGMPLTVSDDETVLMERYQHLEQLDVLFETLRLVNPVKYIKGWEPSEAQKQYGSNTLDWQCYGEISDLKFGVGREIEFDLEIYWSSGGFNDNLSTFTITGIKHDGKYNFVEAEESLENAEGKSKFVSLFSNWGALNNEELDTKQSRLYSILDIGGLEIIRSEETAVGSTMRTIYAEKTAVESLSYEQQLRLTELYEHGYQSFINTLSDPEAITLRRALGESLKADGTVIFDETGENVDERRLILYGGDPLEVKTDQIEKILLEAIQISDLSNPREVSDIAKSWFKSEGGYMDVLNE